MTARLTMLFAVALTTIAALAGCGGGDDGQSAAAGTSSLSTEEFVEKANAICNGEKEGRLDQLRAFVDQHEKEGKSEADIPIDSFNAVFLPSIETELVKLRKLGLPSDQGLQAFLRAEQQAIDSAAKLNNGKSPADVQINFYRADTLAHESGIDACGNRVQIANPEEAVG